jgi:glycosyltransferase involved in cell wall biosynthesis
MSSHRRLLARAVRRAVPPDGWELVYAVSGSVPIERGSGVRVIHQATRHPAIEWSALRRGERETGGRGDMSRAELRRREYEIEKADLIHVTSHAVRDEFLEAGVSAGRLVHSYLGVDLERYRPAEKRTSLTIAFVGPLSLRKGVDIVAELAARVGEDAAVGAVGGATCPWSRRIAERAKLVRWESVPEMLSAAHFFVLPSRSDGFSYAVLEALASGAVPIVTPEVGAAEIVRRLDERLVIEREGFAEAAVELLPRIDLADLSPRARALAEEFDRRRTSREIASRVVERAETLLGR